MYIEAKSDLHNSHTHLCETMRGYHCHRIMPVYATRLRIARLSKETVSFNTNGQQKH